MPRFRRNKPITPVVINRTVKIWRGVSIISDPDDNVTIISHWLIPRKDGTIDKATVRVEAGVIQGMPGFDAIMDAIVTASE